MDELATGDGRISTVDGEDATEPADAGDEPGEEVEVAPTGEASTREKTFVLDTNVILHNANSFERFADNVVVLPMAVIEELDNFKSRHDELGRNARHAIRRLDALREAGRLADGVPMENGGVLRIVHEAEGNDLGLNGSTPDNQIIRIAYAEQLRGERVIFVSKDINARLKADALGLEVHDLQQQKVDIDELFSGLREIELPAEVIDGVEQATVARVDGVEALPHEFCQLVAADEPDRKVLVRARRDGSLVHLDPERKGAWRIRARNREQRMALELLQDPEVRLVTLVGRAGTGKTLLALAAGLEATERAKVFDRILCSRPIIPLGKDIGYLPGDKDEKLHHWMQPIFDNLAYLLRNDSRKVERVLEKGTIELEALTYIRGRSISGQYVIVDEAQNLTPHEVKTIVSRAGDGTKMVLTGDPYQIDSPYLDASSNGLAYAVERLKGESVHGHVTLRKSERSELAALAADLL